MDIWAAHNAHPDSMTDVIGRLISETEQLDASERPAAMDYNARLVTRLRERGLWP